MQNTSKNKTISVIVPCYNYAKYLPDCINSLVDQTYPIHEIIIVNDGSPDSTSNVAMGLMDKYAELKIPHHIRYFKKENGGLSSARNAGIERATGEYIMCLDADDKLVPEAIQHHMELVDNDMCIAQCGLMEFGERHIMMTPTSPTGLERVMQSNTIYCNAVFSKRMWEVAGGYDESDIMRLGLEDWEFWIRMLEAGCYVRTSDFIALRYRVHQNNMTKETTHPNGQKLMEYIYNKHLSLYNSHNLTISGLKTNN